jgi:hypothetical protein
MIHNALLSRIIFNSAKDLGDCNGQLRGGGGMYIRYGTGGLRRLFVAFTNKCTFYNFSVYGNMSPLPLYE